jgi:hypothetical protein
MALPSQDSSLPAPHRYRAISPWALLSLVCGLASATMFFGWLLSFLPLLALYFGWEALCQIERVPEEYTGKSLAKTGMGLGAVLGILLGGWLIFGSNEVPHGYQVLDWADLKPDAAGRPQDSARQHEKQRIYIHGYMLSGKQLVRLNEFSICRTSDQCKYSMPAIKNNDLIRIKLAGDLVTDFTNRQIGVGGIFHVDETSGGTLYTIDADYLYK